MTVVPTVSTEGALRQASEATAGSRADRMSSVVVLRTVSSRGFGGGSDGRTFGTRVERVGDRDAW